MSSYESIGILTTATAEPYEFIGIRGGGGGEILGADNMWATGQRSRNARARNPPGTMSPSDHVAGFLRKGRDVNTG